MKAVHFLPGESPQYHNSQYTVIVKNHPFVCYIILHWLYFKVYRITFSSVQIFCRGKVPCWHFWDSEYINDLKTHGHNANSLLISFIARRFCLSVCCNPYLKNLLKIKAKSSVAFSWWVGHEFVGLPLEPWYQTI